jgi:pilus assembly protein CpaB
MTSMRRVLAALAALLLAAFGAIVLIAYVRGADARAEAGATLVPVLVVDEPVPAGTPAEDVADHVSTVQVPQRLVATGSVADLADVAGLTTTAELLAGEQVMAARFADPTVQPDDGIVEGEPGTQEVSLALEAQRAVGGVLTAGDRIGVFITGAGMDAENPIAATNLVVADVLVTRVQGGTDPAATITVTLALSEQDAAVVIAGMERGTVWLSLQSEGEAADTSRTSTTTTTGDDQ